MIKSILSFILPFFIISGFGQESISSLSMDEERAMINQTIKDWDKAWADKDLALALMHYSDDIDWTNAFGDRVQSKSELEELLSFIFKMDFVMAGENNYGENEINFLNDQIAKVRSLNVRKNQKWPDGSPMQDRRISHLRIYKKIDGTWKITDHMISQAWPKNPR